MIETNQLRLKNYFETTSTGFFAPNIEKIYGKNLQPVTPINPVDSEIRNIIHEYTPESDQSQLVEYVKSSYLPRNRKRAESIHAYNHILTELYSSAIFAKLFSLVNKGQDHQNIIMGTLLGFNSAIFTSKHTEKPVRGFLDIFEKKRQKRGIKAFLSCELKTK